MSNVTGPTIAPSHTNSSPSANMYASNSTKNLRISGDVSKELSSRNIVRGNNHAQEQKQLSVILTSMLKSMGIDMSDPPVVQKKTEKPPKFKSCLSYASVGDDNTVHSLDITDPFPGTVLLSSTIAPAGSGAPDDQRRASTCGANHSREAMLLRMANIFDEVEDRIRFLKKESALLEEEMIVHKFDVQINRSTLHQSKPVVIGDAIPPPSSAPDIVNQVYFIYEIYMIN